MYLDTKAASDFLGIAIQTLNRWRCEGQGPRFVKLGSRVRYERLELERWVADRTRLSTSDPGMTPAAAVVLETVRGSAKTVQQACAVTGLDRTAALAAIGELRRRGLVVADVDAIEQVAVRAVTSTPSPLEDLRGVDSRIEGRSRK